MENSRNIEIPSLEQLEGEKNRIKARDRRQVILRSTVFALIVIAAVAILVTTLWFPFLQIYGTSMSPTLTDGELICCRKTSEFEPGDIVAFHYNNKILVKRVIGQPGDWIDIEDDGTVYVNQEPLSEPYLIDKALGECNIDLPYQVPDNRVFVLGDHRSTSVDSRSAAIGCVPMDQVVGKIFVRIWPLNRIGTVK